jgi:hypothetical protein
MRCPDGGGDINDGGRCDDNQVIGTFAGDRMDMVRGSSRGDGEYAEVSEFVSIRELGRMGDGTAVSGMMSEYVFALGRWYKDRGGIIVGPQLAEMLGFQERHAVDRAMQAVQCMPSGRRLHPFSYQ